MLKQVAYNSIECQRAVGCIRNFLQGYSGRRQVFILIGPFGTGKSWCLKQAFPNSIVNLSLVLSERIKADYAEQLEDMLKGENQITFGQKLLELYYEIVRGMSEYAAIDNIELLYKFHFFDFLAVVERLAIADKKIVISIPGFISGNALYFVDKQFHNMTMSGRLDRFFELKGEKLQ